MRKDELRKLTRQELLEAAKKLEIRGRSTMSKEELVDALSGTRRSAEPKEEPKPAPRSAAPRGRKPAEAKAARAPRSEEPAPKVEPAPPEKPAPKEEPPARRSDSRREDQGARPAAGRSHGPRSRDDEEEVDEQNWNSVSLGRDPNYGRFLAPGSIPPRPGAPASRRPASQNGLPRPQGDSLSDRSERGRMRAVERSHVTREDLRRSGDARRGSGYTPRYGRPQDARDDRSPGRGRNDQGRVGHDARDARDSRDPRDSRDGRGESLRPRGDQRSGPDRRPGDRNPRDVRPDPRRSRPVGGARPGVPGGIVDEGEVGIESRAEMILEAPRNVGPTAGGSNVHSSDGYRAPGISAPPPVRPASGPLAPPPSLPRHYGIDRCRLMVRDPHCIHAYWEIRNETMDRARGDLAEEWDGSTRILRVHGIPISGDTNDPPADSFDIPLKEEESSYYVPIPRPNRGYRIDVGLLTRVGMFYPLASSNTVIAPRSGVSPDQSESWAAPPVGAAPASTEAVKTVPPPPPAPSTTETRAPDPASSGPAPIGESTGVLRDNFSGIGRMAEGVEVLLESGRGLLPSGPGIPPGAEGPTSPAGERGAAKGKAGKFWFVVNTELVIYGATEPDAKVMLQGKPVRLRSDGTFSLRFELPDGEQVLRAEAVSADGDFARVITPVVVRTTTSEERNPDPATEA